MTVYWFLLANIAKQRNVYKPKSSYFSNKNNRNIVRTTVFRKNNKAPKYLKLFYALIINRYFTEYKTFMQFNTVLIKALMILIMTLTYSFTSLHIIKTPFPMFSETTVIGAKISFLATLLFLSYFFMEYTMHTLYGKLSTKFKNNKFNLFLASIFPFYGLNIFYTVLSLFDEKFTLSYKLKGKLSFMVFNIILITMLTISYSIIFHNIVGAVMFVGLLFAYIMDEVA
jgi:hypothetical protein